MREWWRGWGWKGGVIERNKKLERKRKKISLFTRESEGMERETERGVIVTGCCFSPFSCCSSATVLCDGRANKVRERDQRTDRSTG